jgi:glycosyltransferase involved in cell wall biosynthesis
LGEALLNLLRDPALARRLGEAGRRRATSEFAHPTMVRRIEDVYRDALNRASVPDVAAKEPDLRTAP